LARVAAVSRPRSSATATMQLYFRRSGSSRDTAFAQFEREVMGERIRDKIAASKKKGMWMGGVLPLGLHSTTTYYTE